MRYTVLYALIAILLIAVAWIYGSFGWLLLWLAADFLALAIAYARQHHGIFGKRPDGSLAPLNAILLAPYLLITFLLWQLRVLTARPCAHEVAPGLWLGRRALAREFPPNLALIVDLTAEFPEPRKVRRIARYISIPTLDATTPPLPAYLKLLDELKPHPGPIYIHCAFGHGRSALVAAGLLIRRGLAPDPVAAVALLRRVRPGVRLNAEQRALLETAFNQ